MKTNKREIRILISAALAITALIAFVSSCATGFLPDEYVEIQNELNNALDEIDELSEDMVKLEEDYQDLQDDYARLQDDHQNSLESYSNLIERLNQPELSNVSWSELKQFLEQDNTDKLPYVEDDFDCSGFTITLRDNAARCGIRCAYVEIEFSTGSGHALNAFETIDMGIVYIDNTEADQVAYVKIGEPYGVINLDGVKSRYIACKGDPTEFWGSVEYTNQSNPFRYSYYSDYQNRVKFYSDTIAAYNKAVEKYNNGSKQLTYPQLSKWLENIEKLGDDLGSAFYQNGDKVKNIEAYWNQ